MNASKYMKIIWKSPLTNEMILQLHYVLLKNISEYEKYRGIYRPVQVYITGSMHPNTTRSARINEKLIEWYNENAELIQ